MKVPDNVSECVCFLCVRTRDKYLFKGTAFFMSVGMEGNPGVEFVYLVTAKHCVEAAEREGHDLHVRVNLAVDKSEYFSIHDEWAYHEQSDVAVIPFDIPDGCQVRSIPLEMALTDDKIREKKIGVGDDVLVTGLFTRHHGKQRNLPILRAGIISAMPNEPLTGSDGQPYFAYLAELRSIGGLSGSPVFVVKENVPGQTHYTRHLGLALPTFQTEFYFLGLIRGHWDEEDIQMGDTDLAGREKAVNMGIAIVTPSQECLAVLNGDELVKQRSKTKQEWDDRQNVAATQRITPVR